MKIKKQMQILDFLIEGRKRICAWSAHYKRQFLYGRGPPPPPPPPPLSKDQWQIYRALDALSRHLIIIILSILKTKPDKEKLIFDQTLKGEGCAPAAPRLHPPLYSLNKKEWICSIFMEWILEKSEIRVNLEWTFVLFTHFGVTSGITRESLSDPCGHSKMSE